METTITVGMVLWTIGGIIVVGGILLVIFAILAAIG